jgi:hypothetical protein
MPASIHRPPHPWAAPGRGGLLVALLLFVSLPLLGGCATGNSGTSGSRSGPIERADVEAVSTRDALQLVQRLRPQWLRGRGSTSLRSPGATLPVVYLDGVRYGEVDSLRQIDSEAVWRVEFLSAPDATNRFGTGHAGGAILVMTRR